MAKPFISSGRPFKKMEGDVVASTVAVCSDQGGWSSAHAEWLRKPGKAALVREFMDKQMAEEAHSLWVAQSQKESEYGYPEGWHLKPLDVQAAILKEYFPGLDTSHVHELAGRYMRDGRLDLPEGMDGLAVIPKLSPIAYHLEAPRCFGEEWPVYNRAMRRLLEVMGKAIPNFRDLSHGQVSKRQLRRDEKTVKSYEAMSDLPGEVMVLAVQTGLRYRGKSPEYVWDLLEEGEFGLDAFAVGCIILTHPERLVSRDDLAIDCPGSVLYPEGRMCGVPCWSFHDGEVRFNLHHLDHASAYYGSASTRLPK